LHIRTVAAVLIWLVVALLILNSYFRSVWILLTAIVTVIIAVLIYFSPQLRKR
jgi:general stress protein CsbA